MASQAAAVARSGESRMSLTVLRLSCPAWPGHYFEVDGFSISLKTRQSLAFYKDWSILLAFPINNIHRRNNFFLVSKECVQISLCIHTPKNDTTINKSSQPLWAEVAEAQCAQVLDRSAPSPAHEVSVAPHLLHTEPTPAA